MLATEPSKGPPDSHAGDLAGPDDRGAQPLSTPAMIGVAGVTAAIVISAGVFVAERGQTDRREEPAAMAPPPPVAAPTAAPTADRGAIETAAAPLPGVQPAAAITASTAAPSAAAPSAAAPSAAPEGATAPSATSPPAVSAPPPPPPAASLPPQFGYLTARGAGEARVYVNGVDVGPLNEAIKTLCGLRFVRIGTAKIGNRPPSWFAPGQSVQIGCRSSTEISLKAAP